MFLENTVINDRISRAIDNDHTAAMKAPNESRKHMKKNGSTYREGDPISVCMLCKKAFKNHIVYRKHMRLHSDKSHHCTLCGKVFGRKHYLQAHMQTHAKHPCPICGKRFSLKANLSQHLKFHNSPKQAKSFKCSICSKEFYQQEHLKSHLRHHNNERPFQCPLCQKSFNIKSSLQRHMSCHTGEKPFLCDICNRGYTRRSVLMLHIQQVHENKKPYQCDACNLCFSQKGNLQAHFRRKHLQPKSDGKRKDKSKRSLKRMKSDYSYREESPRKVVKQRIIDSSSLHSYASKVKAIVSRGSSASFPQMTEAKRLAKAMSAFSFKSVIAAPVRELQTGSQYNAKLEQAANEDLSDDVADPGCSSSSSGEDVPESLNFSSILDKDLAPPYDIKSLADFESLLDEDKVWEEYLITDSDDILTTPAYELNDVFSSPVKSKNVSEAPSDEIFSWNEDCGNPIFTAEDLDNMTDFCGLPNLESIKVEPSDQDTRVSNIMRA